MGRMGSVSLFLLLAFAMSNGQLLGAPEKVDVNDEIKGHVNTVLSKTNSNAHLVTVDECTKQVVSGLKYVCNLKVSAPNSNDAKDCIIEFLLQHWISTEPQVMKETCSDAVHRSKREVCAGCPTNTDANSDELKDLMVTALSKTNSETKLVNLKECTQQVVAGIKYNCKVEVQSPNSNGGRTCVISILTQPWVSKEPKILSETCSQFSKAKRSLVGGLKDVEDGEKVLVQELASFAVKTLDDIDADSSKRVVAKVIRAQKQLVNGIMYFLKLLVRSTGCEENGEINDNCLSTDSEPPKICDIRVYRSFADDSPLNAKVTKSECNPVNKLAKLGGYEPVQTNGEEIQDIAKFAAKRISIMVNSPFVKRLVNIERASTQIVDGVNYKMSLILGDTDCMKNKVTADSVCKFSTNSPSSLVCDIVVYDKPWEKVRKISDMNCRDIPNVSVSRAKRSGSVEPLDVNSPVVTNLIPLVTSEASQRVNSNQRLNVIRVLNATQKIVSGRVIDLKVLMGYNNCPEHSDPVSCSASKVSHVCDISVWEQPWVHERKIREFSCQEVPVALKDDIWLQELSELLDVDNENEEYLQFTTFLASHDKVYSTQEEYKRRFQIFKANMKKVKFLQKTEQGTGVYGATRFADLSSSEFKTKYLGFNLPKDGISSFKVTAVTPNITLPQSFDWRDYGAVTPVKNQGQCGSCWAFSVTGNIEGQYAIQNKKLLSFSEQELVDCDKYDQGCNGGLFDSAFHALEDLGGLETESQYPYKARNNKCHFDKSKVRVSIMGSVNVSQNEDEMAKWLTAHGPISVALNANAMQFYMGGVSHPLKFLCSPKNLDHGVLIVGFGVHRTSILHRTLPYWIVKNSWGSYWGKQGYYWLYRGDGACGINQMPTSAVL